MKQYANSLTCIVLVQKTTGQGGSVKSFVETHIAPTAYRDVERRTCATGICQQFAKPTSSMKRSASIADSTRRSSSRRHMRSRWSSICSGRLVIGLRIARVSTASGSDGLYRQRPGQSKSGSSSPCAYSTTQSLARHFAHSTDISDSLFQPKASSLQTNIDPDAFVS